VSRTPGLVGIGDNGTVRLDEDNEPQPDLFLLLPPHLGGQARVDEDDYISGPPDLVCEIAASSVSIDLHAKLNAYRRNGGREYLVWRTDDAAIDWFTLHEGRYEPMQPVEGLLRSRLFPGLWLDPLSLLDTDLPRLLQTIDHGTSTPDHASFIQRLKTA
jgi:Uma2 family endonuclease